MTVEDKAKGMAQNEFADDAVGVDNHDDQFVVVENIPIFDEHEGSDGVKYDQSLLHQIAENNNHRIRDTGDYCPVVEWHTSDDNDPGKDPPVVGYAGPFRMGKIGKERPRWCIYADFRVYKDKYDTFKRRPRRSVEIWPENDPSERYIDPIAILGSETPRRDLGLVYSKSGDEPDKKPMRYEMSSASAASGTNTFIPGESLGKKEPDKYIAPAILPAIGRAAMAALPSAAESAVIGAGSAVGEGLGNKLMSEKADCDACKGNDCDACEGVESPEKYERENMDENAIQQIVQAVVPIVMQQLAEEQMGDLYQGEEDAADVGIEDGVDSELGETEGQDPVLDEEVNEAPPLSDEDEAYGSAMVGRMMKRYMKGDSFDAEAASKYMAAMDSSDQQLVSKYMANSGDESIKDAHSKLNSDNSVQYAKRAKANHRNETSSKYSKLLEDHGRLKSKYKKTVEELVEAKDLVTEARAAERYAKRRSLFSAMVTEEGILLDADQEAQETISFSEDQLSEYQDKIRERYQKVPLEDLNIRLDGPTESVRIAEDDGLAVEARKVCEKYRKQGKELNYKNVLSEMRGKGTADIDVERLLVS